MPRKRYSTKRHTRKRHTRKISTRKIYTRKRHTRKRFMSGGSEKQSEFDTLMEINGWKHSYITVMDSSTSDTHRDFLLEGQIRLVQNEPVTISGNSLGLTRPTGTDNYQIWASDDRSKLKPVRTGDIIYQLEGDPFNRMRPVGVLGTELKEGDTPDIINRIALDLLWLVVLNCPSDYIVSSGSDKGKKLSVVLKEMSAQLLKLHQAKQIELGGIEDDSTERVILIRPNMIFNPLSPGYTGEFDEVLNLFRVTLNKPAWAEKTKIRIKRSKEKYEEDREMNLSGFEEMSDYDDVKYNDVKYNVLTAINPEAPGMVISDDLTVISVTPGSEPDIRGIKQGSKVYSVNKIPVMDTLGFYTEVSKGIKEPVLFELTLPNTM